MAAELEESRYVELGFTEEITPYFKTKKFQSKVGGKPKWLIPNCIPSGEDLICPRCNRVLRFLCQVYSPREDIEEAFHRVLYVYICQDPGCYWTPDSLVVLRCQLPQENEFYAPEEEDVEDEDVVSDEDNSELYALPEPIIMHEDINFRQCVVCGLHGRYSCSKCHNACYCSREHQKAHWQRGHKNLCSQVNNVNNEPLENYETMELNLQIFRFPEFEICFEEEIQDENDAELQAHMNKLMNEYHKSAENAETEVVEAFEQEQVNAEMDDYFIQFQETCKFNSSQAFRFPENDDGLAEPLWCGQQSILSLTEVPPCPICNEPRTFEFQVLPQLLSYLNELKIDWANLCIYTCPNSCGDSGCFHREYIHWQQPLQHLGQLKGIVDNQTIAQTVS